MHPVHCYRQQVDQVSGNGMPSIRVASCLSWKWPYQCSLYGTRDGPGSGRQCGPVDGGQLQLAGKRLSSHLRTLRVHRSKRNTSSLS